MKNSLLTMGLTMSRLFLYTPNASIVSLNLRRSTPSHTRLPIFGPSTSSFPCSEMTNLGCFLSFEYSEYSSLCIVTHLEEIGII